MYIGDTDDGSGLHHMVYEVVDNAIDEALAGHADAVTVTLNPDGSVHGHRQRPRHPDRHPQGRGRFGRRSHHDPAACRRKVRPELLQGVRRPARRRRLGGQRAVGLAEAQDLARRQGARDEFTHGDADAPLDGDRRRAAASAAPRSRSCRRPKTFTMIEFDYATLEHRLRELAFLNSGVRIVLTDTRHADEKREELLYEGGLEAFVQLSRPRQEAADPGADRHQGGARRHHASSARCGGTTATTRTCCCFTNNIPQRDGGTHLAGFRGALTRQVTGYAEIVRHRQEGEGRAHRRRLPRGADRGAVGQGARPEILLADQGQAGLLRGAAGGRGPRQRGARRLARGASGRGARSSSARWSRPPPRARRRARRAS